MSTIALPAINFRDLLVTFDVSDTSDRAMEYAQAMARQYGSHLLLMHVVESLIPVAPGTEWIEESAASTAELVETAGMALRKQGFKAESINRFGTLGEQVREIIKAHHVDLLLAGIRAGQGLDSAIFGPNAEKLARAIHCPVLLIGPRCSRAGKLWTPQRILVATRLYPQRANIVIYSSKLAKQYHAQLNVLHVAHPGYSFERQAWENYLEEVANQSPETTLGENQQIVISSRRHASEEILALARDWRADLIVMGASRDSMGVTHFRRGALGEVLAEAACPVLTVRH
jgi:nucleotide-binding universal stress UspA family protein